MDINLNPQPIKNESILSKFLKPKFIFIALGVFILIEAIIGITSIIRTQVPAVSNNKPVSDSVPVVTDGSFTLSSISEKYKVGDKILVLADISTGGNGILGADLILHFDPTVLTLTKDSIIPGKLFSVYPLIDTDLKTGIIRVSGVSEGQNGFNGTGDFASITFTAKLKGSTTISVTYKDGDTKDSNLVTNKGVDVLKKIKNLNLEIN